ncbi:zinc finger BED domain-containing protein RICESLEEPER 3-like [Quercus lobata]|uniref:zinc finger BED domain-containing protein RICESLEEPER 3-like n=1 Tax=Quercus lobata TaxID=97700 RepID=UPI001247103D|nr:zinc finger BED domain-containing protein RICESLEEPER 3-like [Quercus lobata]
MAASMRKKYDKYWENIKNIKFLLYVAVVLDPRYKLRYIMFSFKQVYVNSKAEELTAMEKATLTKLYKHYLQKDTSANVAKPSVSQTFEMDVDDEEEDASKLFAFQYKKHLEEAKSLENKSEVDRFLTKNCEGLGNAKFDILA